MERNAALPYTSEQCFAADAGHLRLLAGGGRSVRMTCGTRRVRVHCRPTLCGEPVGRVDYLVSYAVSLDAKTRAPAVKVERTGHPRKAGQRSNQREATGMAVEGRSCILFYRIFRACNFSSASYQSKSYSTTSILFFFLIQKRPTINFEVFMRSGALSLACYGASRPEFESLLIKYGTGWLEFKLQSLSHVMSVTGG
jgi:hypothetical protein